MNRFGLENLGLGLGLRSKHYAHILEHRPTVDWFELITENYLETRGRSLEIAELLSERYPLVLHGVSLSIGSTDPLDLDYVRAVRALRDRLKARWVSDHLCFTGVLGRNTHDLLPIPYTEASLAHVVDRVRRVSDVLGAPLILENPSTYVEFAGSTLPEWAFLAELAERADCGLLLDVNNVWVSSYNHGFDPRQYLDALPFDRVVQIHLAGHTNYGTHVVDTHIGPVTDPVWELFRLAEEGIARSDRARGQAADDRRVTRTSTMLEWDAQIPSFEETYAEAKKAQAWVGAR